MELRIIRVEFDANKDRPLGCVKGFCRKPLRHDGPCYPGIPGGGPR